MGSDLYTDLKQFLGAEFVHGLDSSWALADDWYQRKPETQETVNDFYRDTRWYVPNLAIFEASGQRPDYARYGAPILKRHNVNSLIDFGAGIASDGVKFAALGMEVHFVELNNLSRQFIQYRLGRLGRSKVNLHATADSLPDGFDGVWLMDVVEHVSDVDAVFSPVLKRINDAGVVVFDTHSSTQAGGRHPFHFDDSNQKFRALLQRMGFKMTDKREVDPRIESWSRATS